MSSSLSFKQAVDANRSMAIGAFLLALLVMTGIVTVDGFASEANLVSMLLLASFLGLASVGQTLCALLGGIDLSIAFFIGAANILLASLIALGVPPTLACVIIISGGASIGALNGLLTFRAQSQALIITLGMGLATVGCAQILTSLGSSYAGNVLGQTPAWLVNFSSMAGATLGLPIPPVVLLWAAVAVITVLGLKRTWYGRAIYAVGGSRMAAELQRISEFHVWISVYAVSGALASLTGIVLLGFSGGGFVGIGDQYLFTTVAAVVIGGTSLLGGWGGYGATILGVLILTVLTSLLVGWGLGYPAQQAVLGLLIVPLAAIYSRTQHVRMQI